MNDKENFLLRPQVLGHLAAHLDEAIAEFQAWGIRISHTNRLLRISRLLKQTAQRASFPDDEGKLLVLSEIIRDAQEFVEIANVLPAEPLPSLKNDLQIAVSGDLLPVGSKPGSHSQYQTQLWVGAMLVGAGAPVGVLAQLSDGKNPDFIISNGTLQYAIEVKRPNGKLDAYNIVRKAARQIRNTRYHGGVIVVDL